VPRITDFCGCIYVLGCRLSLVRLCDSDFGITPVDDVTIGITCAAVCWHITHVSFASSWYLFCLSVIVLARLYVFGTAMSIKKVLLLLLLILTATELSLDDSSPYASTNKINKNKYTRINTKKTQYKQYETQ